MSIRNTLFSLSAVLAAAVIFCGSARAQATRTQINAKLAKQAKISLDQARQTALNTTAGDIEELELEKEHGKLVYSFDIRNSDGTLREVQVDARTGAVVRNKVESKAEEEKEKRENEKRDRGRKPNGKQ